MFRIGFGVACAALMGAMVGCTTDVEDPGFTGPTAGATTEADTEVEDPEFTASGTTVDPTAGSTSVDPTDAESSSSSSSSGDPTTGDPTTGDPTEGGGCGDGIVSPGEQCDGADLQDLDCTALGLGTGTLGCDPMMCTFDTSMCMSDSGGTSG